MFEISAGVFGKIWRECGVRNTGIGEFTLELRCDSGYMGAELITKSGRRILYLIRDISSC